MNFIKSFKSKYSNEIALGIILVGIFVLLAILSPDKFLSTNNIKTMMFQMPEFGIIAIGMMIVILTGGINLAITNGAALSSIVAAFILSSEFSMANPVIGVLAALIGCLLVAAMTGVINGTVIAYVGVAPMLVTLGTKTLFEGIGLNFTKGGAISGFPAIYSEIGNGNIIGIPIPIIIYVGVIIISYLLIQRSAWGTEIFMVGSNETATRFSGINTKRTLMKVYLYSGIMSGIAAIIISSRYNSAKTDYGSSYLMRSITAVVLGGTSISGGHGSVMGTILAVAIIQIVSTGLNILQVNRYIIDIITGAILILVLAVRYLSKVFEDRRQIKLRSVVISK
jgi:simple sugar transport system permease protein